MTPVERLHKFLAEAGVGSRRQCEEYIQTGRVSVDGRIVTELGLKVDPGRARIEFDGNPVRVERKIYFLFNKPRGVVCSNRDPRGRPRVVDYFARVQQRVFPVGRLDVDSEGLIIVTNDGTLCNLLTHPRYEVPKTYLAKVRGRLAGPAVEKLQKGVWLAEGKTQPAKVRILKRSVQSSALEITLKEGKNREVRRVLARVGYPVSFLQRTQIGRMFLGALKPGQHRPVTREQLLRMVGIRLPDAPPAIEEAAGPPAAPPPPAAAGEGHA